MNTSFKVISVMNLPRDRKGIVQAVQRNFKSGERQIQNAIHNLWVQGRLDRRNGVYFLNENWQPKRAKKERAMA